MAGTWKTLKKLLGFMPRCANGGTRTLQGECLCRKNFEGQMCENIVCRNNGTRLRIKKNSHQAVYSTCRCPHPQYISGRHCELINCANGGRDLGQGSCICLADWYHGQFCQYYSSPWGLILSLPMIFIIVVVLCCVICRLDLCSRRPRRTAARRHANRRHDIDRVNNADNADPPGRPVDLMVQLDTAAVFNERFTNNKPLEPPPSYDQVISDEARFPGFTNGTQQARPPSYFAENSATTRERPGR